MLRKTLIFYLFVLAACAPPLPIESKDLYRCTFERMEGVYTVSEGELLARGAMITVHRGARTFMFKRYHVKGCEKDAITET